MVASLTGVQYRPQSAKVFALSWAYPSALPVEGGMQCSNRMVEAPASSVSRDSVAEHASARKATLLFTPVASPPL